jgi:predicted CoA-binding protein
MVAQWTTLVLGASTKPERYAYKAITQLRAKNYPVVAVGAKTGTVAGVEFKTSLEQLPPIHTVSMYLSPARQEMYYDKIIALQPQRVLFNPGTENPAFAQRLQNEGIAVENACNLVLLATDQYET